MNKSIDFLRNKNNAKKEQFLKKMLEDSPNNADLLIQLAKFLLSKNKKEEALVYIVKAKAKVPSNPLMLFISGKILWSLEKYDLSISEWDKILDMCKTDIAENASDKRLTLSIVNDSRFYKADCLYHLYRDKEALSLMKEHLLHRGKGIGSDFTKKEAVLFYKILKYSKKNNVLRDTDEGYASKSQGKRIETRMNLLEKSRDWDKMIRYLKIICKHYPREYYYKTVLSEYCAIIENSADCINYAQEAYIQEPNDPLVKYNFAVALMINGRTNEALIQFEEIVTLGVDYIAFSEHGEGMQWARNLLRDTKKNILKITQTNH